MRECVIGMCQVASRYCLAAVHRSFRADSSTALALSSWTLAKLSRIRRIQIWRRLPFVWLLVLNLLLMSTLSVCRVRKMRGCYRYLPGRIAPNEYNTIRTTRYIRIRNRTHHNTISAITARRTKTTAQAKILTISSSDDVCGCADARVRVAVYQLGKAFLR